jgi:nitrate/TMAO reductase-like tetraheme cytochrome c subunit
MKRTHDTTKFLVSTVFCLTSLFAAIHFETGAEAATANKNTTRQVPKLDNETCLSCHESTDGSAIASSDESEKRQLRDINGRKYAKSVHGEMECISCHKEITDASAKHKLGNTPKPDCVSCHLNLWETTKKENLTKEKARLGLVVKNIETYIDSYHARRNVDDDTRVNAYCDDCHNTHTFSVPPQGTSRRTEWHLTIPYVCGEKCHTDQLEEYSQSVHGKAVLEQHNLKAADCTDCHTSHSITSTLKDTFKLSITENCGTCHTENLETYRDTYHGKVNKLGYGYTAKCYDCHGSHGILRPDDPESKVHPDNRLKTCRKCHKEATEGFVTFSPHATAHNFERYPQVWIVTRFMWSLLIGVFVFFWLHTGLWWYREAQDRKASKNHPDRRKDTI